MSFLRCAISALPLTVLALASETAASVSLWLQIF